MKVKYSDVYDELKKQGLTDEEIADAIVFPVELTPEEQKEADEILRQHLTEHRKHMSQKTKDELEELRQKLIKKDNEKD